ncbi:hypothetical protein JHK85_004877 [Glycine max]|nr:hypothetical protein JHK85_004877 [Glycine max]
MRQIIPKLKKSTYWLCGERLIYFNIDEVKGHRCRPLPLLLQTQPPHLLKRDGVSTSALPQKAGLGCSGLRGEDGKPRGGKGGAREGYPVLCYDLGNLNHVDSKKWTSLHYVAWKGHVKAAE